MRAAGAPLLLPEGATREHGAHAQAANIMAARAVADTVRATLGPRGRDKMLVDATGEILVTNDGATILQALDVAHPAAKMIAEVARAQDEECGDGTTTSVLVAGALLEKAEELLGTLHATVLVEGFRLACERAIGIVAGLARRVAMEDERELLLVAQTAMGSKAAGPDREHLARLAIRAVRAVTRGPPGARVDLRRVRLLPRTGAPVGRSEIVQGVVIEKARAHAGMPGRIEGPRIALVAGPLGAHAPVREARIRIHHPDAMTGFADEAERASRADSERIVRGGATFVACGGAIDDAALQRLAAAGVLALAEVAREDLEALGRASGARVVPSAASLDLPRDLGCAARAQTRRLADREHTVVEGAEGAGVTLLVRGQTSSVALEAERTVRDALGVVRDAVEDTTVVPGAGAPEIEVALGLRRLAPAVGGRRQLAIEAFADAVEIVPRALAENAGLDALDRLAALREAHARGRSAGGLDVATGRITDAWQAGVLEPLRVKRQCLQSATDLATMILRIDDVIAAKPSAATSGPQALSRRARPPITTRS